MSRRSVGRWTSADIPDQSGRTIVVTGANSGIGFETARLLAAHGARVVLACRDLAKSERAAERIRAETQHGATEAVEVDLSSLASVRLASADVLARFDRLDILINNAGVMEPPYQRTVDGFELTFATNHLGPFALTGLLLSRLAEQSGSRVVTVSSQGHKLGVMDFEDPQSEKSYDPERAYYQSKLANLLFTYELDRRLQAAGMPTIAVASHPGLALTNLFRTRSAANRFLIGRRMRLLNFWFAQSVQMGALPTLRAATDPEARGGDFFGPGRRFDTGFPDRVQSSALSYKVADQARLWQLSENLTHVTYPTTEPSRLP